MEPHTISFSSYNIPNPTLPRNVHLLEVQLDPTAKPGPAPVKSGAASAPDAAL
jgi:hypothetical protein